MVRFSITPILQVDKENKKGLCPVVLEIIVQRRKKKIPMGFSVPQADWDKTRMRVKGAYQNAASYNSRLIRRIEEIERDLISLSDAGQLSSDNLPAFAPASRKSADLIQLVRDRIEQMKAAGKAGGARHFIALRNILEGYSDGSPIPVGTVNKAWLEDFERHCRSIPIPRRKDGKKAEDTTIWTRFKTLNTILNQAVTDELIPVSPMSDKGYQRPRYKAPVKSFLSLAELDKLIALLGTSDLSGNEDLILSFFLIECTAGIRHSDWSRFTVETIADTPALRVGATKKTGEPIHVPITPGSRLERVVSYIQARGYRYTLTESAYANRLLASIATRHGIDKKITTHTGRHTAATLLLEKGFSREAVAEVLGITIAVVDTYAKMTRQKVRNEFKRLGGI